MRPVSLPSPFARRPRAGRGGAVAMLAILPALLPAQQAMTLQQAIAIAQERGLAARAARSARAAARWNDRAFHADLLPQLSLTGDLPNVTRAIVPVVQPDGETVFRPQSQMLSSLNLTLSQRIPLTGSELFVASGLTRIDRYGQDRSRLWQSTPVTLGIRQELFRPNDMAWDGREQSLNAELAERQYREAMEDVAVATSTAFFNLYAARMAVQNATTNVAVNDTLYTLNKGRYEVGKIGENDLLQSELALLRARTALDGAKLDYERALAAFKLQLNLPADTTITIEPPAGVPVIAVDTALAVAEALRNRSQMEALELQEVQARRRVDAARLSTGFGATVTASAGFNQSAPVFGDAYHSLLDQQRLQLSVQMPLVQWGARHARIEAAEADAERVASTARASRQSLAQEAHFAALELMQSQRQLALSAKADTVASKRFEVAKNRYVIGKIGISDLYIAQSEKDAALTAYVQALQGYWLAYYRLRRLTLYDFAAGRRIE